MKKIKKLIVLVSIGFTLNAACITPSAASLNTDTKTVLVQDCPVTSVLLTASGNTSEKTDAKATQSKSGWFKEGKYTYYRMKNGKLCTKKWVRINGKYYSFDAKGRMRTGLVTDSQGNKSYFSKKDGHFLNYVLDLTVVQKYSGSVVAKDRKGGLYDVSLDKLVNKNGKKISETLVKKNSKIQVSFTGDLLETCPAQFVNILKVKLIK